MWNTALRPGGALIIAVPNNALGNTIIMNPEHITSFVPSSLTNAASCVGFRLKQVYTKVNGVSFVSVFEKVAEAPEHVLPVEGTVMPQAACREEELVA